MMLDEWANTWGIKPQAVADLRHRLRQFSTDPTPKSGISETAIQTRIRLEASKKGLRLWRNNLGACTDTNGNFIRYGLANDSAQLNDLLKSSDLIGIRPVLIQQHHVGTTFGQFVAREVKAHDWHYSATEREIAQLRFIQLIIAFGGDAAFATREGTL